MSKALKEHFGSVWSLAFSRDGPHAVVESYDRSGGGGGGGCLSYIPVLAPR